MVQDIDTLPITIIAPVFNEEEVIRHFVDHIANVKRTITQHNLQLIFVNDGSSDKSQEIIEDLSKQYDYILYIELSRNFGKESAITAGLDHVKHGAAIIMDVDLQHPPKLIPRFIDLWQQGYEIVYGVRTNRLGETWWKKLAVRALYAVLNQGPTSVVDVGAGDFRLLGPRAIDAINRLRERNRFMKGIYPWVGYDSIGVDYQVSDRVAGNSRWTVMKMFGLGLEGITSFSVLPLRLVTLTGIIMTLIAISYGLYEVMSTLVNGITTPGYVTIIISILFVGGLQLVSIGIVAEYVGKSYLEVKNRPIYIVKNISFDNPK